MWVVAVQNFGCVVTTERFFEEMLDALVDKGILEV